MPRVEVQPGKPDSIYILNGISFETKKYNLDFKIFEIKKIFQICFRMAQLDVVPPGNLQSTGDYFPACTNQFNTDHKYRKKYLLSH